jgi:predicted alpha/beta-hydrolase family hydrolase
MLFLQGTRDALADAKLLSAVAARLGARATLSWLQDADHSWHVPARSGRTDPQVRNAALHTLADWIDSLV